MIVLFAQKPTALLGQTASDSISVNKVQLATLIIENQTSKKELLVIIKKLNITKKHLKQAINDVVEINEISNKEKQKALSRTNGLLFQRNLFIWTTSIGIPIAYVGGIITIIKK